MKIVLKEFKKEVFNGDRATQSIPYALFEVWVGGQLLQTFDGRNNAWGSYKKFEELRNEALSFTQKLGQFTHEVYEEKITKE